MQEKFCQNFCKRRIRVIILVAMLFFCFVYPFLATAQSLKDFFQFPQRSAKDYFQIFYKPIAFSPNEVYKNKIFYLIIQGRAACIKNLPLSIKEVRVTVRILAQHKLTGKQQVLNQIHTIYPKSFPKRKWQYAEINQRIALKFPKVSQAGEYIIIGKLIKTEIKLPLVGWQSVTKYFPQSKELGSIRYISDKK